jgi:hypothetical protein
MRDTPESSPPAQPTPNTGLSENPLLIALSVGDSGEKPSLSEQQERRILRLEHQIQRLETDLENLHKVLNRVFPKYFHPLTAKE